MDVDVLAGSSKLQEESAGLRSAAGHPLSPWVAAAAVKLSWKLGRLPQGVGSCFPSYFFSHPLLMGKKRKTPLQTTYEERDPSIHDEAEAEQN